MMVNIGGFLGPFIAGYVRAISWDWVFIMSSFWIALNFIPALFLYEEPTDQAQQKGRPLKQVMQDIQEVLGNARFALIFFGSLIILMAYGAKWLDGQTTAMLYIVWFAGHYLWNISASKQPNAAWYRQKFASAINPLSPTCLSYLAFGWCISKSLLPYRFLSETLLIPQIW